jgi:hypothetical protein
MMSLALKQVLQEVLAVEYSDFKFAGIQVIDATQIDTAIPGFARHFIVRVNAAATAEIVFGDAGIELVETEVLFIRLNLEHIYRDRFGTHQRPLARTDRAGTAQAGGDFVALVGKLDGAAMATAVVVFAHGVSLWIEAACNVDWQIVTADRCYTRG